MKYILLFCLMICQAITAYAGESEFIKNKLTIRGSENRILAVEFFKNNVVKFSYRMPQDTAEVKSQAVDVGPDSTLEITYSDENDVSSISSDLLKIVVQNSSLNVIIYDISSGEIVVGTMKFITPNDYRGIIFPIDTAEGVYGGGSHALPLDRTGYDLTMWNHPKFGYEAGATPMNFCVPFFIFGHDKAIFIDNYTKGFGGVKENATDYFSYFAESLNFDFYVIKGENQSDLLKSFTELTGRQALPPRWIFGYLQSLPFPSNELLRDFPKIFAKADYPIDAVICDYFWFGDVKNLGDYEWDSDFFGPADAMFANWKSHFIKSLLITEPFISIDSKNYSYAVENGFVVRTPDGTIPTIKLFGGKVEVALLDLTDPKVMRWFSSIYERNNRELGVDAWWCDLGEPEEHNMNVSHYLGSAAEIHNIFANCWMKGIFDNWNETFPTQRPFFITRAGWAGMQKYGTIPWSGDVKSSYSGLEIQIPIMLNMSLCGQAYMHSDIGGFWALEPNDRLFTRWTEFGAFSPVMRAHSSGMIMPVPLFFSDITAAICKKYTDLRYSLLPYIYTLAYENTISGKPIVRAMNYDSEDPKFRNINSQYFFGDDILVAPVMDSTDNKKVIFPAGNWIDYHDLTKYRGISEIDYPAAIDILPLFVRGGALIPRISKINHTDLYSLDTLLIDYYFDDEVQKSSAIVYDDDGISQNSIEDGNFEIISLKADYADSLINFSIKSDFHNLPAKNRIYKINVLTKDDSLRAVVMQNDNKKLSVLNNPRGGIMFYTTASKGDTELKVFVKLTYGTQIRGQENAKKEIAVRPNPVHNEIIFNLGCFWGAICQVEIYNYAGQKVYGGLAVGAENVKINTEELPFGSYHGTVKFGEDVREFKFVKE